MVAGGRASGLSAGEEVRVIGDDVRSADATVFRRRRSDDVIGDVTTVGSHALALKTHRHTLRWL